MRFFHDCWFVCWRELLHFLRSKVSILASIFQPLVWLLLVGHIFQATRALPGFPARSYLDFMTPGVLAMVALFGGSFGGMTIIWDRRLGFLSKPARPAHLEGVYRGWQDAFGGHPHVASIADRAARRLFSRSAVQPPACGVFHCCSSSRCFWTFAFSGISLMVGALVKQPETFWAVVNFLTVPVLFTSSALFPLEFVPSWLRTIAYLNPVTYAIDSMRALMIGGWQWSAIAGGILIVAVFSGIVAGISTAIFARRVELSTL